MQERQWITDRRSELDALAEQLTKQLQKVQVERDELGNRGAGVEPPGRAGPSRCRRCRSGSAQVAGRAVLLIPHHSDATDEAALPGDYRRILA
ncbi:hypothetical protein AB0N20_33425, partial [Streptomyces griseoincarnatus]